MVTNSREYTIVSVTVAAVLLVTRAVQVLCHVRRCATRRRVINALHQAKRSMCFGILKSSRNTPDGKTLLVLREVEGMREKQFVSALSVMAAMGRCQLLYVIWKGLLGEDRWMTPAQDAALCAAVALIAVVSNFPDRVRGWVLDACFAVVMLCLCGMLTLSEQSPEKMVYLSTMSAVPRLLMSLASGKLWLVLPLNLACGACVWLRYAACTSHGVDSYQFLLQQEVVVAVFAVWCAILANEARWDYAREMITRKMLLGENSATATLLNLMCDVVVELDANLKLVRQAPKLEAMLALHSTRAATLQQYMPNEVDQSRFQDVLCPEGDVSLSYEPGALHSTLRDSWGNHISVEMFYIQFRGPDLCLRTFVGLREFADQQLSDLPDLPSFPPKRKHRRGKQKPDVAEKEEDEQTEQGDRCLDAGITKEGHQQGHGSQQAAPGQLHGTHPVAAMPSAIERRDDK
mmetsp:Transcript_122256/g.391003  ORF Transcript_122256/g.391003 Transcript_122256/m.391003 type:complete len:460 (+) Transcript_122256:50-1429(+)